jgi:hypothetical protein
VTGVSASVSVGVGGVPDWVGVNVLDGPGVCEVVGVRVDVRGGVLVGGRVSVRVGVIVGPGGTDGQASLKRAMVTKGLPRNSRHSSR